CHRSRSRMRASVSEHSSSGCPNGPRRAARQPPATRRRARHSPEWRPRARSWKIESSWRISRLHPDLFIRHCTSEVKRGPVCAALRNRVIEPAKDGRLPHAKESLMPQRIGGLIVGVLLLLLQAGAGWAQSTMGTITGLVTDSSQAVIPGATVTAKNLATGAEARTTTSSTGNYVLINLPVGSYELSVNQAGFKNYVRTNIPLSGNETARIDIALAV